jgi:hypothetical protein
VLKDLRRLVKKELNFGVSTEDVDKLIVSYYKPRRMKISPTYNREIRHHLKMMTVKVIQICLTTKEMKETFNHHEHFLSMMEESDLNADRSSEDHRSNNCDTACYRLQYQKKS